MISNWLKRYMLRELARKASLNESNQIESSQLPGNLVIFSKGSTASRPSTYGVNDFAVHCDTDTGNVVFWMGSNWSDEDEP